MDFKTVKILYLKKNVLFLKIILKKKLNKWKEHSKRHASIQMLSF